MERSTIQQEILLLTTTTLSNKQLCVKDELDSSAQLSKAEQLEAACWNGLIDELLPGVIKKPPSGKKLYLWNIRQGPSFLQIELKEFPSLVEKASSINTIYFLSTLLCN